MSNHFSNPALEKTIHQMNSQKRASKATVRLVLRTMTDVMKEYMREGIAFQVSRLLTFIPLRNPKLKEKNSQ